MSDDNVIKLGGKTKGKASGKTGDKDSRNCYKNGGEKVCCNFCGRTNEEVLKMVKGPGVNICSECVMIAVQYLILQDRMLSSEAQKILDAFWHKN